MYIIVGVGQGGGEGGFDIVNIFKLVLVWGELNLIGVMMFNEYQKYIEKDVVFE